MEAFLLLGFVLLLITLIGHGIWVLLRWIIRQLAGKPPDPDVQAPGLSRCSNCNATGSPKEIFCGICGARKPSGIVVELLKDLTATERQVERFRRAGGIQEQDSGRANETDRPGAWHPRHVFTSAFARAGAAYRRDSVATRLCYRTPY
jgi:hypothetical protein